MELLHYRAGADALALLRARGLRAADIATLVLPAIGPKWLIFAGLDRALLEQGFFDARPGRMLLFGASVGAWRALALAARDPLRAHAALLEAYCTQRFTRADDPAAISCAYRELLSGALGDADLAHAAEHPRYDLAIATARARGVLAHDGKRRQALCLGAAIALNALHPRAQRVFFERALFSTERARANYPLLSAVPGVQRALTPRNMRAVALASGTVPVYMQLVRDIPDAPGAYLDGGFSDYHLNRPAAAGDGLCLLLSPQRRLVPSWLDKFAPWRRSKPAELARLLIVHPSAAFVRSLPGRVIPTRHDFERFVDEPELRIARWREAAARSGELGRAFLDDIASGAIAERVRPL